MSRRALLVGIDHYQKKPLNGCVKDAQIMEELLSFNENEDPNFDCELYISNKSENNMTGSWLKQKIYALFNHPAEVALFYFSGHGASTVLGSYLVTQLPERFNEGVNLSEVISMANNSKVTEIIIILDCCHSGGIANFVEVGEQKALLREGVSILAASRETGYARQKRGLGVFTSIIYDALNGGAADILGNVTVSSIYSYVDLLLNSWEQRPVFKSHVSKMIPIRKCLPRISKKVLKKLTKYFQHRDKPIVLSPSYNVRLGSENEALIQVMEHLTDYFANGLLEIEGETLLETAAQNQSCQLTPKGKYYWDLVTKKQL